MSEKIWLYKRLKNLLMLLIFKKASCLNLLFLDGVRFQKDNKDLVETLAANK